MKNFHFERISMISNRIVSPTIFFQISISRKENSKKSTYVRRYPPLFIDPEGEKKTRSNKKETKVKEERGREGKKWMSLASSWTTKVTVSVTDRGLERSGQDGSPEDVCPQKPWSSALSDGRSVDLVTGAIHHSRWLASHAARGETRVTTLPSLLATFDWLRLRLRW